MYLRDEEVKPGDKDKVVRLETKLADSKRGVVDKVIFKSVSTTQKKAEMLSDLSQIEKNFGEYWCEGDKCMSSHSHWVLHSSKTLCWECSHDPCACSAPLVWDKLEMAWYSFYPVMGKRKRTHGCWN